MRSAQDIARELEDLIQEHYYREDFELLSAVRAYRANLAGEEVDALREVVLRRIVHDSSIVDILLCSVVEVPAAAPLLAARLAREDVPSQTTRALLTALQQYRGDEVFAAVARFVDSDQENEALRALARIDFARALPHFISALRRDQQLDLCLHILHDRGKLVGLPALAAELRQLVLQPAPELGVRLARALRAKRAPFNPFPEADLAVLLAALA